MDCEKQKAACAEYAQSNGGSIVEVARTSGRKGAVVLSKDGRVLYDPFVMEPVKEVITKEPMTEMEEGLKGCTQGEVTAKVETRKPSQRRKPATKKK